MEEAIFYIGGGRTDDKHSQESFGYCSSIHSSQNFGSYRQADCRKNGSALTGIGPGERLFVASPNKALVNVYAWGKESVDQKLPVPEALTSIALCPHPIISRQGDNEGGEYNVPKYRLPWLLIGGTKSGKMYVWDLGNGNLIFVKDVHYQAITTIKVSQDGGFIFTGGDDSRCVIYSTMDVVSIYNKDQDIVKPFASFADHSLPVTDIILSDSALINDVKFYTVSLDCTIRCYNLMARELITTFVLPAGITAITCDPAFRVLYAGMVNGTITSVPLYQRNPTTAVLESVGGLGKIVTIDHDPNLIQSFVFHQQSQKEVKISQLAMSLDGMTLISGDDSGKIFISDIVTKQIIKATNPCSGSISVIEVFTFPQQLIKSLPEKSTDKKHRLIPPLKRVLAEPEGIFHDINLEIPKSETTPTSFSHWIHEKAQQELEFKLALPETPKPTVDDDKLIKISNAYADLKTKYDQLLADHKQLLNN